jgi:hypothetical protein
MKASDAKPFIGKTVRYWHKRDTSRARYGQVVSTAGRNIQLEHDWLWAPDILRMELVESEQEPA